MARPAPGTGALDLSSLDLRAMSKREISNLWSRYELTAWQKKTLSDELRRRNRTDPALQAARRLNALQPETDAEYSALEPSDLESLKLVPLQRIVRGEVPVSRAVELAAPGVFNRRFRRPESCGPGTGSEVWEDPDTGERYSQRRPELPRLEEHPNYRRRVETSVGPRDGVVIRRGYYVATTDPSGSCIMEMRTLTRTPQRTALEDLDRKIEEGTVGLAIALDPESRERGKSVDAEPQNRTGGVGCRGMCPVVLALVGVIVVLAWG